MSQEISELFFELRISPLKGKINICSDLCAKVFASANLAVMLSSKLTKCPSKSVVSKAGRYDY